MRRSWKTFPSPTVHEVVAEVEAEVEEETADP